MRSLKEYFQKWEWEKFAKYLQLSSVAIRNVTVTGKNPRNKDEDQQQEQPLCNTWFRNWTRPQWGEARALTLHHSSSPLT